MRSRLLLLPLATATLLVACGGNVPTPVMEGRKGMLSKTAVSEKCEEAAKGHTRPFVVEWDATDLASFEASAQQRTMFVRYQGCKMEVLYECKDPVVLSRFGSYGQPQFTSGTVQGMDIANEGELYAKLPLGAATLSGRFQTGESLHLKYFVSGVATSSRDSVYRAEVDKVPGCAGATHYVWAYNLGAFELESKSASSAEAQAGMAGMGAGGKGSTAQASVGQGGDLKSCTTQDQRGCRVPIRLALRAIGDGQNPLDAPAGTMTAGRPPVGAPSPGAAAGAANLAAAQEQATAATTASELLQEANRKLYEAHDGGACLQLLDKAVGIDPRQATSHGFDHTYSRCLMVAGKCDEGKKRYREMLASQDTKHLKTDAALDQEATDTGNQNCPSSTAKNDADFVIRASLEMHRAVAAKDGRACKEKFESIFGKLKSAEELQKQARANHTPTASLWASNSGTSALGSAAKCIAESISCKEGLAYHKRQYCVQLRNMSSCEKIAEENWATQIKLGHVKCK